MNRNPSRRPSPHTPFIPPLNSPSNSPQPPQAPVIPTQNEPGPNPYANPYAHPSPWFAGPQPPHGSYPPPVYPAFSPTGAGFIPPYVTPNQPPGVLPQFNSPEGSGLSADFTGYPPVTPYGANAPLSGWPPPGPWPPGPTSAPPMSGYPGVPPPHAARGGYYPAFGQPSMSAGTGLPAGWGGAMSTPAPGGPSMMGGMGGLGGMPGGMGGMGPWGNTPAPAPPPNLDPWGITAAMNSMNLGGGPPNIGNPGPHPSIPQTRGRGPGETDRIDRFAVGNHYGPSLTPLLVHRLKVDLQINPLLLPAAASADPNKPSLVWDMLFPSNAARLSSDPPTKSWSAGRSAPATFPRVTELNLIFNAPTYPTNWMINVKAAKPLVGVTCGEVIERISQELQSATAGKDYNWLLTLDNTREAQRSVRAAYQYNRSTTPGVPGGMLGEAMKRLDFLRDMHWWDGIEVVDPKSRDGHKILKQIYNEGAARLTIGMPCLFVIKAESRTMRSMQEARQFSEAARDHLASGRPSSSTRSRAGSRASYRNRPASRNGGGIHVHAPSDSESSDETSD